MFCGKNFDLISFEVWGKNIENETIFYQYSFCSDTLKDPYESTSVTVIPLKKGWSVFIDKK